MKIRRFYSKNMRGALRQIAEEFGEDAAILSSQKTASGVEVIAALDYDEDLLPSSLKELNQSEQYENQPEKLLVQNNSAQSLSLKSPVDNQISNYSSAQLAQAQIEESSQIGKENEQYQVVVDKVTSAKVANLEWSTDPGLLAMREELGLMRSMMSEQLKGIGWERFSEKEPVKAMLTRRLSGLGISQLIINRLIPLVNSQQDAECSWQNLLALLAKSVDVSCQDLFSQGGVYAFMGPAGAGKTTSIAKIAARFVIKHGKDSVGLISTDNYRISAQQQLGSFARLLGIPMLSVSANRSIDHLLNQFKGKKLVLIDTAGMSKNDVAIAKQLNSLKNATRPIKRFLMMPATNQLAVLKQSLALFDRYSPYSVIITKLDEAASLGEVLSLAIENNLPIALTTDGQRVPEDIRIARNHHLVSKAVWLTNKYGSNAEDWQLAQQQQRAVSA